MTHIYHFLQSWTFWKAHVRNVLAHNMQSNHDCHLPPRCSVSIHLCGAPCKFQGKNGCLEECAKVELFSNSQLAVTYDSKVSDHEDDDHQCAAVTHACGEVTVSSPPSYAISYVPSRVISARRPLQTDGTNAKEGAESQCKPCYGRRYSHGHSISDKFSDVEHECHQCDAQYCPIPCQLCKRLCSSPDHLHALEESAIHLCGYVIFVVW